MRGELRIYLGCAAGVGKTCAMLTEGHSRKSRGTDVIVGYVETHGRQKTSSLVDGLEVAPRKKVSHRGKTLEEMDVDYILERMPQVVLIDELAHSNVAMSQREKRFEDVRAILNAGITVIGTLNIQHLESLNDVIFEITGVRQNETVPDSFVRSADQIELVDMAPEALRRRIAHGNVYPLERSEAALNNFFKVENLSALRELALLWLADRVEESLKAFRERHAQGQSWETKERILVALSGVPGNDQLIRRAARLAMRSRGSLIGVHVSSQDGLASPNLSTLERQKELLASLGGTYLEVSATSIVGGVMQVAKAESITQIVLGASGQSHLKRFVGNDIIDEVVRASGHGIDVHVVSVEGSEGSKKARILERLIHSYSDSVKTYRSFALLSTVLVLPLATFILSHFRHQLDISATTQIFLLLVTAIGFIGGLIQSIVGAIVGFLLLNFYFAPPIHTFTISNSRDLITLITFLIVSSAFGFLIDLQRRRLVASRHNEIKSRIHGRAAEILVTSSDPSLEMVVELRKQLRRSFAILVKGDLEKGEVVAADGVRASDDNETIQINLADGIHSLHLSDGVLEPFDFEVLAILKPQLEATLTSRALTEERRRSEALKQGDDFRKSILAAVSHDLRTPLAAIRAAASGLLEGDVKLEPDLEKELVKTIDDEARNLTSIVSNLLDLTRINMGGVSVMPQPTSTADVVDQTLLSMRRNLKRIVNNVAESTESINADQALLERALANIIENAIAFSPNESMVEINATSNEDSVVIEVQDEGVGIAQDDIHRVFEPFQRSGDRSARPGIGLGLAVARGFVEAQGGRLEVISDLGVGTKVRIIMNRATTR
ncbi:MAG: ATP-binding protein [Actinomycetota bacterium]|nr:ATP-binding protein [Actinomycetota bacterium]